MNKLIVSLVLATLLMMSAQAQTQVERRGGEEKQVPQAAVQSHSSSTLCEAKWPQLVEATQGDTFQREILVSRHIANSR
jgi:3-hydroxyisobutyrate dehydrogenase-like beta-hydroxyacid dehydrogenase